MMQAARVAELRRRLLQQLGAIAEHAQESSLQRCPYRDMTDVCTFSHGCRNQLRTGDARNCSGAVLNSKPERV
jgi:hypothetical protein